ncbi:AmmeMemoRadiSam system protein B [Desulfonatronovibrio hydrogenovorans]|uniref:AmmeMemoRadiSam system protein B n=1 Tax=Desulfonatronovibrio hydrogenovorans TaxID=53245 RepID=UPI000491F3C2|nr:AmmeMemoRadiSam system protein B [Desulfonatronovibrio hydrogenovorans]
MDRTPVVAGQFYPSEPEALNQEVAGYLKGRKSDRKTILAMVPHAGYVFSGKTAGKALAMASLATRVILLGPNHTGRGTRLAVWPDGDWVMPGFRVKVDRELAGEMTENAGFSPDYQAHLHEHSLEVILPFLRMCLDDFSIVPAAVAEPRLETLMETGRSLAELIQKSGLDVCLVVSSDMSHYISHDQARKMDMSAIDRILALDPEGLFQVVRNKGISMCGILPMVLGLTCAIELGAQQAVLADYSTSGEVNQDFSQVVGYAGILVS